MYRYVAMGLIAGLVVKDLLYIGDRYVMRSIAQVACLVLAFAWLTRRPNPAALSAQWLSILYLFVLFVTALGAERPLLVLAQVISLLSVVFFAIALYDVEGQRRGSEVLVTSTWFVYGVILCLCVVAYRLVPHLTFAYEWGDPVPRFKGLFGEPATLGMVAGLTIGLTFFGRGWWWLRWGFLAVAAFCLALTFSRTFWVACSVAGLATLVRYYPRWRLTVLLLSAMAMLVLLTQLDTILDKGQTVLRANSLTNLSGRTAIWEVAYDKFLNRPLLGYGFTFGSDAIDPSVDVFADRGNVDAAVGHLGTFTLHNGYVQAMLDSGFFGVLLYTLIVFGAIGRLWFKDRQRQYPTVMYVLIFSAIGNIGETHIFGAAQTHSIIFWMLAVFALGFRPEDGPQPRPNPRPAPLSRPINVVAANYSRVT